MSGYRLAMLSAVLALPLAAIAGTRREVVIHGQPFPDQIVILVDRSASMSADWDGGKIVRDNYARAIREARWVAEQASDAGRVRFYAFNDTLAEDPQGWYAIPDADKLKGSIAWLRLIQPCENTNLAGAMEHVLALPESPLGVIIITDEQPDGGPESTAAAILELNKKRKEPAMIGVIGISPRDPEQDRFGVIVARGTGGAYVRVVEKK